MGVFESNVSRWKERFEHVDQVVMKPGVMIGFLLDRDLRHRDAA